MQYLVKVIDEWKLPSWSSAIFSWLLKKAYNQGMLSLMVIVIGNGIGFLNSNIAAICVLLHTNVLEKSMNPSVLSQAMGKY